MMKALMSFFCLLTLLTFSSALTLGIRKIQPDELGDECRATVYPEVGSCEDWGQLNTPCYHWPNTEICYRRFKQLQEAEEELARAPKIGHGPVGDVHRDDAMEHKRPVTLDDMARTMAPKIGHGPVGDVHSYDDAMEHKRPMTLDDMARTMAPNIGHGPVGNVHSDAMEHKRLVTLDDCKQGNENIFHHYNNLERIGSLILAIIEIATLLIVIEITVLLEGMRLL